MRILHISKYYHPFRGGIEKVVQELAEGAVKAGHEVTVVCSSETRLQEEEVVNGVKVLRVAKIFTLASQPINFSLLKIIKSEGRKNDLIHMHTPNPLAELAILVAGVKTPVVTTYHCDVLNKKILAKLYQPVCRKLLDSSNKIFCATKNHIKYSNILSDYSHKTTVIPFGTKGHLAEKNIDRVKLAKAAREKFGNFFLFVGRLVPYKGVGVLLKALQTVNAHVVLIGKGPKWSELHRRAKELGVVHKVSFLGQVDSDDEFASLFHSAKGLVLPSVDESEAFGMVQIEAMSCELPVISTNLKSGVSIVNQHGVTGLLTEPKNAGDLAAAMNAFLDDEGQRKKWGSNARQRFEKEYKLETMVEAHLKSYEEVLGLNAQARPKVESA